MLFTPRVENEWFGRELLDGLVKKGYKLNFGPDDSGFLFLALERGGGYYLGVFSSIPITEAEAEEAVFSQTLARAR